jgi:HEAT repeat protein
MLMKLGISSYFVGKLNSISQKCHHLYSRALSRFQEKVEVPIPVLIEALKDEEGEIRWYAAWALSRIGSEAKLAVEPLIEALKDQEGEVRILAAKALSSMGSEIEIPVPILVAALDDQERYVRNFATRTLEKNNKKVARKPQQQSSEISL